jgi:hypothetical protein
VMTCNGDLRGISGFQDVVMANLLGSGGGEVTVTPRDSNLRPTHQKLSWPIVSAWYLAYLKH